MNSYNSSLTNTYSDRQPAPLSRSEHTALYKENRPVNESVREGQQLRGEIINRTTTDVTIRLSNGQTLQARLDVSVPLSIGQTASFEVTHADPALISLHILQDETAFAQNALIQKALSEAELPVTSRNTELVNTLLRHNLPINKESILSLIRQSNAYPNADINTLALLTQHKLPVTQATLTQFEAYQNYEHQILPQLANLAYSLSELAASADTSLPGLTQMLQNLFTPTESLTSEQLPTGTQNLTTDNSALLTQGTLPSGEPTSDALMQHPLQPAEGMFTTTTETSEPLVNAAQNQAATVSQPLAQAPQYSSAGMLVTQSLVQSPLHSVESMPTENTGTSEPLANTTPNPSSTASQPLAQNALSSAESILTETTRNSYTPETAGTPEPILNTSQSHTTTGSEPSLQNPVQSGSTLSPSVATEIPQNTFVQQLLTRWTLSPKDLTDPGKVKEFYHRLRKDLAELHSATTKELQNTLTEELTEEASRPSHDKKTPDSPLERLLSHTSNAVGRLQDNLEFMNMLNRIFPYVQLPIRFSDKTAHGELYVYTKKEKLRHENGSISVLLHLDMEALGPTDIHLSLTGNQLNSRFYLNDPTQEVLFTEHLPELKETLASKGFDTNFELIPRKQEEDPVREFLSNHDTSGLSRFTFDCRA